MTMHSAPRQHVTATAARHQSEGGGVFGPSWNCRSSRRREGLTVSRILITQAELKPIAQQLRAALPNPQDVGIVADNNDATLAEAAADSEVWLNHFRRIDTDILRMAPRLRFI